MNKLQSTPFLFMTKINKIMNFFFLLCFLFLIPSLSLSTNSSSSSSSCPIDFNYVNTFPWDTSACTTTTTATTTDNCCQTLRSLIGIGLADHLKKTSTFFLPNLQSSISCLKDFQSHLTSAAVRQPFSGCLTTTTTTNAASEFVANPSNCAGIVTLSDWVKHAGPTAILDSICKENLTRFLRCSSCLDAGMAVNARLVSLSRNSTKCFTFTALYVAGIVSGFGPEDIQTASCVLGVPLSKSRSKKTSNTTTIFAISGSLIGVTIFLVMILIYRKRYNNRKKTDFGKDYVRNVKARVLPNTGAKWFRIAELDIATNGFSQENFIGKGGFGMVYKGTLSDGTVIAVKKTTTFDTEADNDFINEAEIISKIRHRNLLPLRGFCATSNLMNGNERYLIYDFMPNGSLHDHIFNKKISSNRKLSWPQRKSIIIDVAKGLSYLHNGIKPAIFHRDIKSTNILLDSNMKALVADFGLAKQNKDGKSQITTRIAGTYGYVAPEYALYGQLTEKSDVYSFGIIVLEIMSGKKVLVEKLNGGTVLIADWVWEMVRLDRIEEVFDSMMGEDAILPKGVMGRFVRIGLLCAHSMVAFRPTIWEALKMLEGDIDIPRLHDRPLPLGHESFRTSFERSNMSLWSSSEGSVASSSVNTQI